MRWNKKLLICVVSILILCWGMREGVTLKNQKAEQIKINVFVAASLKGSMEEIVENYRTLCPEVEIVLNADSSGTLMNQIREGYECDIFFSAAQKQMEILREEGFVIENYCTNLLKNKLVVIKAKGYHTLVTGLENLERADSIALAAGSVPVGKYTRQALVNLSILPETEDVSTITTAQIMDAMGTEISEQGNVSKVLIAVAEGACEVGTVYYSDLYGYQDKIEMIELIDQELTGDIIYPIAMIRNEDGDALQEATTREFYEYLCSEDARKIFEKYLFEY